MPKAPNEKLQPAIVHRPTDSGVDLPPGRRADELAEEDYRAVEMEEPGRPTEDVATDDEAPRDAPA